jgi:hypothetical protein
LASKEAISNANRKIDFNPEIDLAPIMDLFARAFFDTSFLLRGGWPASDSPLTEIFLLVRQLDATILIPEVVELEMESLWMRQLYAIHNDEEVTKRTQSIVREGALQPADWETIKQDYRAAVGRLKKKWSIAEVRTTTQSMRGAASYFIASEPGEESIRSGFRDTVIYLSVVDRSISDTPLKGVLITADTGFGPFNHKRERKRIADRGAHLEIPPEPKGLVQVRKDLIGLLEGTEAWRKHHSDLARAALWDGAGRGELDKYIQSRIEYPPDFPYEVIASGILTLELGAIATGVREEMHNGDRVDITAEVKISLHGIMRPRLGFGSIGAILIGREGNLTPIGEEVLEFYGTVIVGATAIFNAGRYEQLQLKSSRLISWYPASEVYRG